MNGLKKIGMLFLLVVFGAVLFASPIELSGGKLKLVLYPETGSFSLFELSDIGKNRYEPLFDDRNFSTTSWFSVLANGRIFKLGRKPGKPILAEQTSTGARFVFTLTDDFQVEQEFSFVRDTGSGNPHAVRIDTRIENTSGKPGIFALKALVDTILGETEGIHFSTNTKNRISAETQLSPIMDGDSVIVSKNNSSSCVFYLDGPGVSVPDAVLVSNWDRLNTLTWIPDSIEGRSFNTVYSVNDSALLFVWPENPVRANEILSVGIIIGSSQSPKPSTTGSASGLSLAAKNTEKPVSSMTLVQQLLDRIAEIEANPDTASDDELRKLNEALDIMLKAIKE